MYLRITFIYNSKNQKILFQFLFYEKLTVYSVSNNKTKSKYLIK